MNVLLLAHVLLAGAAVVTEGDTALLPPDGLESRWKRVAPAEVYPNAELYGYIDGGAEIFLELGFENLTVQRYTDGRQEVTVELYRMTDPIAAEAIYLERCGRETPSPALAARHTVGSLQLQLTKGPFYLAIVGATPTGSSATMVAFAAAVAARIPAAPSSPLATLLPREGLLPGSMRFIRGPFGLQSLVTLGEGDVLLLANTATAVAGRYGDGAGGTFTRVVAEWPAVEGAAKAFANLTAHLDPYLTVVEKGADRLVFRDHLGAWGVAVLSGARLELRVGLRERP